MEVTVVDKQAGVRKALRDRAEALLEEQVEKYISRPAQAHVTFSREGQDYRCDCSVHIDSGIRLNSSGQSADIYECLDQAAERMAKRVRRYKRRLKDHHASERSSAAAFAAPTFVIAAESDDEDEGQDQQPIVIAETKTDIQTLSVGEAVMHLDLLDAPLLLFHNAGHGGLNVVYRRQDGNTGWIDPGTDLKKQTSKSILEKVAD